jgi:hypothetical protein
MQNGISVGNASIKKIRLHIKKLIEPTRFSLHEMIEAAREVYSSVGFDVEIVSIEDLSVPNLMDLDVGRCMRGETTEEQADLFEIRGNASTTDIVVYIIRSTIPEPLNGCAAHPNGKPACVVTRHASRWTFGHEVGHVLSLNHILNSDCLMYGRGTDNITNPPPDLLDHEVTQIKNSGYVINI